MNNFQQQVSFIWGIADLLRDSFKRGKYQDVMLPFTVLRRIDCVLAPTKERVLRRCAELRDKLENPYRQLCRASGFAFYNTSRYAFETLLDDAPHLAHNLRAYINGFSENMREVLEKFDFNNTIAKLHEAGLLFLVMERFKNVDLHPDTVSNLEIGYIFEELVRKFNEALNENPGEHFTPREVIRLMVNLILAQDQDALSRNHISRTVYDPCCGSGGMLTIAKERIQEVNPNAQVFLFGQEVNPETFALCRSDLLMKSKDGRDADNIKFGSTLSDDQLAGQGFDYLLANPPYGKDWKRDQAAVQAESDRGYTGRFGAGLPRISDGQLLFLQHMLGRMKPVDSGGSRVAIIMNGSPLFTGDAANGAFFADTAAGYLCDLPARLSTGYVDGEHGSVWATRELLQAITPYCSADCLARLEQTILEYYSAWERTPGAQAHLGYAQLALLDAVDPVRRSAAASARLREWQRKFKQTEVSAPRGMQVQAVPSPIPVTVAEKMTEDQWLSAIAKYSDDRPRFERGKDGHIVGGALELSRVLEERVTAEPERFHRLMLRFPSATHPIYFGAVLDGLAKTPVTLDMVASATAHCHRLPGRPVGRSIVRLIEKMARETVPDGLLEILGWYAIEDPDPDKEYWRTQAGSGNVCYGGDIAMAGLNSTRGAAADSLAKLLFADRSLVERVSQVLDRMVEDASIAVRSWVAETLVAVLNYDRDYAVALFLRLCSTEDVLLGTRLVEGFLRWALRTHFDVLRPVLVRMLDSDCAEAAEAGARQACLAGLHIEEAQGLTERCLKGTEKQRIGAAHVFAANVDRSQFRQTCLDGLVRFFHDSSDKVQDAAADCFRHIAQAELGNFGDLMAAFVNSAAYAKHSANLVYALHESPFAPPEVICLASERFIGIAGASAGDISQAVAGDARLLSELVLRAYASTSDEPTTSRCLDAIDKLLEVSAYGIEEALREHDR